MIYYRFYHWSYYNNNNILNLDIDFLRRLVMKIFLWVFMKKIIDKELREYQERLGVEQYRVLYSYESNKVRRLTRNNIRQSRKGLC